MQGKFRCKQTIKYHVIGHEWKGDMAVWYYSSLAAEVEISCRDSGMTSCVTEGHWSKVSLSSLVIGCHPTAVEQSVIPPHPHCRGKPCVVTQECTTAVATSLKGHWFLPKQTKKPSVRPAAACCRLLIILGACYQSNSALLPSAIRQAAVDVQQMRKGTGAWRRPCASPF